ncbi:MAG: Imm49 family immunity protein [bacterium]
MDLSIIKSELSTSIQFDLDDITYDNALNEIGSLCEGIYHQYRSLAICKILMDGDTDGFYHDLIRSAHIRLYYLSRCHNENYLTNPRIVASRSEPFFDALAADQLEIAAKIGLLSAQEWWPEDEYEDDFYYAHFIHRYITFDPGIKNELEAILTRFEKSLQGDASARLEVCKGFITRDQQAFDAAFYQLLDERTSQIELDQDTALGEEMTFQTERHIFIEGLAILKIAEKVGFTMQQEYLYCPAIARLPMKTPFPDDGYPHK